MKRASDHAGAPTGADAAGRRASPHALAPMSAPMGTLRRAWRGGLLLIGALFAAFALLALGIAMQAATRDIRYRWYAQQASATVIDKVIHHAGDPSTPRSQYLVRYRFVARDGSTQYGIGTLPFDTWDALRPGARLTVAYLPARAYGSRPLGDFGDGEAVGWGLIGVILGGVGLALLVVPLRRAWRIERLLREGIETEGTVDEAENSGWRVNRVPMWRVKYSYTDAGGVALTGRSGLQPKEAARAWKKGDTGAVRYDTADPTRSIWVAWP